MIIRTPIDLAGGYWAAQYPTPVPAWWAMAACHLARKATHVPWRINPSDETHTPPVPTPAWVAVSAAPSGTIWVEGIDFTVSNGQVTFLQNPYTATAHKADPDTGEVTIWCGEAPPPPVTTTPQAPSYPSVVLAAASYADSPAFASAGTVEDVTETARGWVIVTDAEIVTLPPDDTPSVVIGDEVATGDPAGSAWRLVRLGPVVPGEARIAVPAEALPAAVGEDLVFYNTDTSLAVSTALALTRARFAVGGSVPAVTAFWAAVEALGEYPNTLAQSLDTRVTPYGEPHAFDLPSVVNPAELVCEWVLGGNAYMLVVDSTKFGPAADPLALADYPAGPGAAVWVFDGVPSTAPYLLPF